VSCLRSCLSDVLPTGPYDYESQGSQERGREVSEHQDFNEDDHRSAEAERKGHGFRTDI